jgi:phosphoglycerate dehydrogenase-like enzyme
MTGPRVVLHPQHPFGVDTFLASVPDIRLERPQNDAGVAQALSDGAEVLVTYTWRDEFLTPSLKWIAGTGAGAEQYPQEVLAERGVTLTTAVGVHSVTVAEHAFALLLALTRRVGEAVRHMTGPRWQPLFGEELLGKKMAVIGLGRIGEQIALRARAFGMEVIGLKRNPDSYTGCLEDVRGLDALDELCDWAEVLVLSAPANADGSPMILKTQLDLLGKGWLVNVGRGSLIDPDALLHAVTYGALKGAGLDVTSPEPLPEESPLWSSPKVVITAHYAGAGPYYGVRWGRIFEQNLAAYRGAGEWENRIIPAG